MIINIILQATQAEYLECVTEDRSNTILTASGKVIKLELSIGANIQHKGLHQQ